jgi:hypothetical protein
VRPLNADQLRVLKLASQAQGDGWFHPNACDGRSVAALTRRQMIASNTDHNGNRRIRILPLGVLELKKTDQGDK